MKLFAGIDLGGTKIYCVIIDEKGKILGKDKQKTKSDEGFENVILRIHSCYKAALLDAGKKESDIQTVGMAVPGAFNVDKGLLINAPNLGWKNIELSQIISAKLSKPVFIDNDANMGIYGEYSFGKCGKTKDIYGLFIGTGIGGGYIVNGDIVRGQNFTAGEIGHAIVKLGGPLCNCGKRGCFEALASKTGMINFMKEETAGKKEKTLLDELNPDWRKSVGSKELKKSFLKNDRLVVKALTRSARVTGIMCANIINMIGIGSILLGGGLIEELGDVLLPIIRKYMDSFSFGNGSKNVLLETSSLGDDAIALGSAWYASRPENAGFLRK